MTSRSYRAPELTLHVLPRHGRIACVGLDAKGLGNVQSVLQPLENSEVRNWNDCGQLSSAPANEDSCVAASDLPDDFCEVLTSLAGGKNARAGHWSSSGLHADAERYLYGVDARVTTRRAA